jgi:tripartite-type tricarboxylate transporter receptor subunit TctC
MKSMTNILRALAVCALVAAAPVSAQKFPEKPVRLIVPFPPGGAVDLLGRLVAERLQAVHGYTVIVDNRPGASGHVGAELASRAPADGYTIVGGTIGIHAAYSIYSKLNYDPATSLQPIMVLAENPNVVSVPANSPFKTFGDFLAAARAQPGKLNFGSAGPGSSIYMVTALFEQEAGVKMNHVAYKGSGPALIDLISGQIDVMFENLGSGMPHYRSGKLRPIAVTGAKRDPQLPDVPTIDESGVKGYAAGSWFTLAAPAGVPAEIIEKIGADVRSALDTPEAAEKFKSMGVNKVANTPAEAKAYFASETDKWTKVIKAAGVKLD